MDSFPVLRDQTQKKILFDLKRTNNEQNKTRADAKLFKDIPTTHLSSKDCENKDPAGCVRKPFMQPAVSRIPVLAKSLSLQTSSEFKHMQWESKTLASKAKRKKLCTRPVPFNFSQSKRTTKTNTRDIQPETSVHGEKPSKHQGESNKKVKKSHGKTSENASQVSGQFNPLKTSNIPLRSKPSNAVHQDEGSSAKSAAGAEVILENMKLLSLKETTKSSDQTTPGNPSKALSDKGKSFQPDHSALLSILRNEGISLTGQALRTPQSKSRNNLPMRVSVMSRPKAGPTTGLARVQFFLDPAALQSVLQNEGVKAGGAFGATPTTSVCPPNRNTSIYTAQRVPVKKKNTEGAVSFCPAAFKETPLQKWTPQRVRNTKHQPMSSMKLTHTLGTPGPENSKNKFQPCQKGVVQRLFEDQDEDQKTPRMNKEPMTQKEQLQVSSNNSPCKEKLQACRINCDEEEEEWTSLAQPRESVIFFSTGKNLFRAPRPENGEVSAQQDQPGPFSSDQMNLPASPKETSAESEPAHPNSSSVLLHRELISEKAFPLKPAVVMLRKRLEELRLDEEVSTYTSVSGPAVFLPPQPRCGNPLASILLFEESTKFVPIIFDLSSGPSQLHGSPLHER
nr:uncharacterized protein troap [Nothobranchius furzeri]XP_015823265.2 uncharacterized protein troap [Nothobranchius furzeri]